MSAMSQLDTAIKNVYNKFYTIEGSQMEATAKHWKCTKCGATYHSPIKLTAVLCTTCSRKSGAREVWMKQDD